ncbi:MAG TPA: alpha/beta hydrolase [Natronosporangium sp.]
MRLTNRLRRVGSIALAAALVTGGAGAPPDRPAIAYPAPDRLPAVTVATLQLRYGVTEQSVQEALAVARAAGDQRRGDTLARLLDRQLLEFDARGNGRAVEVLGDLATADRIAVLVPGSHTTLDTFDRNRGPGGGARALREQITAIDPAAQVATVAWLGYDAPQGLSPRGLTDGLARAGATALRDTIDTLREVNPTAPISLLCHSYGSVVCGHAAADLPVAELVLYGSPGVCAGSAADLATPARVWAGRASNDWIRHVPFVRVAGIGFGTDPVSPEFGALVFPAGDGGHGDYHQPGSVSLRNLAQIVLGQPVPADSTLGAQ